MPLFHVFVSHRPHRCFFAAAIPRADLRDDDRLQGGGGARRRAGRVGWTLRSRTRHQVAHQLDPGGSLLGGLEAARGRGAQIGALLKGERTRMGMGQ